MLLQAKTGYWLTESFAVAFNERRFLPTVTLSSADEAKYWEEISNQEKEAMQEQAKLLEVENVDYEFLKDVKTMLSGIRNKINSAGLTNDQALEMKSFFPDWEDVLGTDAAAGFKFNYQSVLMEVVTPHVLSEGNKPKVNDIMLLAGIQDETVYYKQDETVYYRPVLSTIENSINNNNE